MGCKTGSRGPVVANDTPGPCLTGESSQELFLRDHGVLELLNSNNKINDLFYMIGSRRGSRLLNHPLLIHSQIACLKYTTVVPRT